MLVGVVRVTPALHEGGGRKSKMLIAEQHNKLSIVEELELVDESNVREIERMEDVLTSNVFGIIKNLPISVLNAILEEADMEPLATTKAVWEFWPKFEDNTEPDIVVSDDIQTIIIEIKYLSDFDKGTADRKPQLLREYDGGCQYTPSNSIKLLTITRNQEISWTNTVSPRLKSEQQKILEIVRDGKLKHCSWRSILKVLKEQQGAYIDDPVSSLFLNDLVDYLEYKAIGIVKQPQGEGRDMVHFFGEEVGDLDALLQNYNYRVSLSLITEEEKRNFIDLLISYIKSVEDRLSISENTIEPNNVSLALIMGENGGVDNIWSECIQFCLNHPKVDIHGKNNISVRLKFKKGNVLKAPVSLFTYDVAKRELIFRQFR